MNEGTTTASASAGVGVLTTAATVLDVINEYAVVIGFILTIASLLFAVYSHIQTMKWRMQQDKERIATEVAKALEKLREDSTV